jgi:hypothetical protein
VSSHGIARQSAQLNEGDRRTPVPVALWLGTGQLDIAPLRCL